MAAKKGFQPVPLGERTLPSPTAHSPTSEQAGSSPTRRPRSSTSNRASGDGNDDDDLGSARSSESSLDIFEGSHAIPLPPTGMEKDDDQDRSLGLLDGIALIVGNMIGSGIFVSAGPVYAYTNSVTVSLMVWVMGGLVSMTGALCYAELGTLISDNGGEYVYLLEAFGRFPALAFVWTAITILKSGSAAILAGVCGRYTYRLITLNVTGPHDSDNAPLHVPIGEKIATTVFLLLALLLNGLSTKLASKMQKMFFMTKLLAIAMISAAGLYQLGRGTGVGPLAHPEKSEPLNVSVSSFLLALQTALWGYDGWNNLSYVGAKVRKPEQTVPRAIGGSVVIVLVAYVLCNVGYFIVLPAADIKLDNGMAVEFGKLAFGAVGQIIIPLFIICSSFSALNAGLFSTGHMIQAAAAQSHFPAVFAVVNRQHGTPVRALALQGVLALPLTMSSHLTTLIRYTSFAAYLFYGTAVVGLLVLRYISPKWKYTSRPYRVWPTTAVFFVGVSLWMVAVSVLNDLLHAVYLLLWISFGFLCWAVQQFIERRTAAAPAGYAQAPVGHTEDFEMLSD